MLDYLVLDVEAIDGSGKHLPIQNLGVQDGRIVHDVSADSPAHVTVQGRGNLLVPGFIDMHAHADLELITGESPEAKLRQGVSTQVIGQDGLGYAPTTAETHGQIIRQIAGWNGPFPQQGHWSSIREYADALSKVGGSTNSVLLVPHGNIRMMVIGMENRQASLSEMAQMREILELSLLEGARGLSAGLTYTPGMYANTDELIELCKVVATHGGYFSPHTRSYGLHAIEAYREMIDVARQSGVHLHLTHATMNFEVNRGRAEEFLNLIDTARKDGISISLDSYPYTPGATSLAALLPSWIFEKGQSAALKQLLAPEIRKKIQYELDVTGSDGSHGCVVDWDQIEISGVMNPGLEHAVGKTILELATHRQQVPSHTALDLIIQDQAATTILMHVGWEENIQEIMKDPWHCVSSDGITVGSKPHPRAWGSFTKFIKEYVLEQKIMPLPEAIRHLVGNAASVLNWHNRGSLQDGSPADLVLLNLETIKVGSSFSDPKQPSHGVELLLINGKSAVEKDTITNARAGIALTI